LRDLAILEVTAYGFLRGRVEFPTGGIGWSLNPEPVTRFCGSGGSGERPEPTVTVWMGEGKGL